MNSKTAIDILILSYAQTDNLKKITTHAVQSLMRSEDPEKFNFNVVVLESQKSLAPFQYEHATTVYPDEEFNFHRYFNIGINMTSSPYICLCNNDILFQKGWASQMMIAFERFKDVKSASPVCPYYPMEISTQPVSEAWFGYRVGVEVQGACLLFKREVLKSIGQLDPNFKFYSADLDYADTFRVMNYRHMLVRSSIVFHLGSKTLNKQEPDLKYHLTEEQDLYYKKKWYHRTGRNWVEI